ncbi:hypothetical protein T12_4479 [Trichinella patagoniensis]|uniref:Uncharacterized protein n=1 Tax=Trichinella patagoniensis TaxID=990121 RepID=A0A0V0ZZ38_9BILA|nr:hypothetical protein T12_2699 [Trichinella patagoniensis]KRY17946.1 hypothetical protein T12_4479 [Trichinella patagoniensis]
MIHVPFRLFLMRSNCSLRELLPENCPPFRSVKCLLDLERCSVLRHSEHFHQLGLVKFMPSVKTDLKQLAFVRNVPPFLRYSSLSGPELEQRCCTYISIQDTYQMQFFRSFQKSNNPNNSKLRSFSDSP